MSSQRFSRFVLRITCSALSLVVLSALVARRAVSLLRVVSFVRLSCLSLGFSICCSITSTPLSRVACSDYVLPCLACLPSCLVCRLSPLLTIVTLVARPPNSRNLASSQTAPVFTCRVVVLHHGHLPVSRITSSDLTALAHPHATLTSKNIPRLSVRSKPAPRFSRAVSSHRLIRASISRKRFSPSDGAPHSLDADDRLESEAERTNFEPPLAAVCGPAQLPPLPRPGSRRARRWPLDRRVGIMQPPSSSTI